MTKKKILKIGVIVGEESGDILASDAIINMRKIFLNTEFNLYGVGGAQLTKLGLQSFFPMHDISVMGIYEVIKKLPTLLSHINDLGNYLIKQDLDFLFIVDSPDFTHRVAAKIKQKKPNLPIYQYVCPSVWAWRPERAKKIAKYIDHIFALLPFEPEVMMQLGGPQTSFVGHKLASDQEITKIRNIRNDNNKNSDSADILLLPGSRISEINKLMPIFGEVVVKLQGIMPDRKLNFQIPTLEHLYGKISAFSEDWTIKPQIIIEKEQRKSAFIGADIALAASGTILLELALCNIPTISCYKLDLMAKLFLQRKIKIWSAALPNIIINKPVIPEFFNEYARADLLAHNLAYILQNKPLQQLQMHNFAELYNKLKLDKPAGIIIAEKIGQFFNLI